MGRSAGRVVHPSKKGKGGDNKRTKGEHLDSIENKRARLGGPACMPESWRNRDPSNMFVSFDMPVREDGSTIIFFQANSQLPAFGRYVLECSEQERIHRVLDNPMGVENLWAPQTASPWNVCLRDGEFFPPVGVGAQVVREAALIHATRARIIPSKRMMKKKMMK